MALRRRALLLVALVTSVLAAVAPAQATHFYSTRAEQALEALITTSSLCCSIAKLYTHGGTLIGTLPTADGTSGQALVTNGAGVWSFGTPGGLAPSDATFVTLTTNTTLTNERVLTGTANQITITDNGAGSTVVVSIPTAVTLGTITATSLQGIIGNVTPAAGTFTTQTGSCPANTVCEAVTGYSVTGSGTTSMVTHAGTLNTSGTVHVNDWSITNTASNAASTAFRIRGGAAGTTTKFGVRLSDGALSLTGTFTYDTGLTIPASSFVGTTSGGAIGFRTDQTRGWIDLGAANANPSFTSGNFSYLYAAVNIVPASGSLNAAGVHITPIFNGTSSGTAYGLLVAPRTTAWTGGTIKIASFGTTTTDGFTGYSEKFQILTTGSIVSADKLRTNGTAPTVGNVGANSCGTTAASLTGTDVAGKVTVGATSGTQCRITFASAWASAPACTVTNETTANLLRATSTTTTVDLAGTMVGGDVLAYLCIGGS